MVRQIKLLAMCAIAILPSPIKIQVLRMLGAKIGRGCYIGLSVINAKKIEIADCVRIGHLNIIHRLACLRLDGGSKIESLNWITGGGKGVLALGRNASIRRLHFLEASGSITIGANTIVAGRNSLFFTHGLAPGNLNDVRPITIGSWCYVGAACRFLPGSAVADRTFVGMGSVVTKAHVQEMALVAGNPAKVVKLLPPESVYFAREFVRHAHHPKAWVG